MTSIKSLESFEKVAAEKVQLEGSNAERSARFKAKRSKDKREAGSSTRQGLEHKVDEAAELSAP